MMVLNIISELSRFPHFQSRWLQLYNYIGYGEASNPYDNTTPSPVFTGDTGYFKKLDFSDF